MHKARRHSHRLRASSLRRAAAQVPGEPASPCPVPSGRTAILSQSQERTRFQILDSGPGNVTSPKAMAVSLPREDCSRRPRQATPTEKWPLHLGVRPVVSIIHATSSRVRVPNSDFRAKGLNGLLSQSWHKSQESLRATAARVRPWDGCTAWRPLGLKLDRGGIWLGDVLSSWGGGH